MMDGGNNGDTSLQNSGSGHARRLRDELQGNRSADRYGEVFVLGRAVAARENCPDVISKSSLRIAFAAP
jgi:hypothetical protein